jgi:glucose/mannose transport system substrate-binding protein
VGWRVALLLLLAGCVTDSGASTVQIYSWWTTASEAQALNKVLDDFKQQDPNVTVTNPAANNAPSAQQFLEGQVRENDAPDTFQVNGGIELEQYVKGASPNPLTTLDSLATQQNWEAVMPSVILSAAKYGGTYYAVPVDVARVNALFYNKVALANAGIASPPASMAEFVDDAQALAAKHLTALAIGDAAPWALEVIFKSCLVAAGHDYYTQFISGANPYFAGTAGLESDPIFDQVIACFGTFLSYSNKSEMRNLTWDAAVSEVNAGNPVMTIMGDWAHGEFLRDLGEVDVTFGEVAAPGTSDTFIYTTDAFVLPAGAKNPDGALALLAEWGSARGQGIFYQTKGSLPSRSDADPAKYDALQQWTLAELQSKVLVPDWALALPQAFATNFDAALDRFADDGNAENLVLAAKNNYDLIVDSHWP